MQDQSDSSKCCSEEACPAGRVWLCAGCGEPIKDAVVLRVGPDQRWHAGCLRCDDCCCPLEGSVSCFLREGRTLCRADYERLFAGECWGCRETVLPSDLVVRAGGQIYHPACLCCSLCGTLLMPGDCFTLGPQGPCCQADHTMPESHSRRGENSAVGKAGERSAENGENRRRSGQVRRARARTILSDAQLEALRSCYSRTPWPDARVKLRLGQLTGLSPRVICVWFQNKRCQDKKSRLRGDGRSTGPSSCTALLYAAARPMVVCPSEPPDFALQIYVSESPWQPPLQSSASHEATSNLSATR